MPHTVVSSQGLSEAKFIPEGQGTFLMPDCVSCIHQQHDLTDTLKLNHNKFNTFLQKTSTNTIVARRNTNHKEDEIRNNDRERRRRMQ